MKQLEKFFRIFFLCLILLFATASQQAKAQQEYMDSVEIGLITCSPHEELYSLYGHCAVRYHDLHKGGMDLVFNWGVFNFAAPNFLMHFITGMTDYELAVSDFAPFCLYYKDWGSQVTEQVLNLTAAEKRELARKLMENAQPENKVYRYNFFYDNCTTRPRNIIERSIKGKIIYSDRQDYKPSYRQMIHEMNAHHPWAAWGNDLLLGLTADRPTDLRQQEFLPHNLLHDYENAHIQTADGQRPLVKERRIIVKHGKQELEEGLPITPIQCALVLAIIFALVLWWEVKHQRCLVWFDALYMLALGLAGCIVLIFFFSLHPTTSTNLQILIFNPIHLFFIRSVLKRSHRALYWTLLMVLSCALLMGSIIQDYAEGVEILALCLLSRSWSHRKFRQ